MCVKQLSKLDKFVLGSRGEFSKTPVLQQDGAETFVLGNLSFRTLHFF